MDGEERRVWIRLLVVLSVVGVVRLSWMHRPGAQVDVGEPRDVAAALDSVVELQTEADRRSRPLGPDERLDPNTASEIDLDRLPGVGPATAAAIVAGRAEEPYRSTSDLTRIRGIGSATVAKMGPHLSLAPARGRAGPPTRATASAPGTALPGAGPSVPGQPPTPAPVSLDLNRATALELTRVPGIGPALAERIVNLRDQRGRLKSVDALLDVRGIGPATLERIRAHLRVR